MKGFVLTVEGLDGAVLLLPVWLEQSSVENAAEVTCRLQHDALVRISQHQLQKLVFEPVKAFQITFLHPAQTGLSERGPF